MSGYGTGSFISPTTGNVVTWDDSGAHTDTGMAPVAEVAAPAAVGWAPAEYDRMAEIWNDQSVSMADKIGAMSSLNISAADIAKATGSNVDQIGTTLIANGTGNGFGGYDATPEVYAAAKAPGLAGTNNAAIYGASNAYQLAMAQKDASNGGYAGWDAKYGTQTPALLGVTPWEAETYNNQGWLDSMSGGTTKAKTVAPGTQTTTPRSYTGGSNTFNESAGGGTSTGGGSTTPGAWTGSGSGYTYNLGGLTNQAMRTVDPKTETVAGQLQSVIASDSPLMQQARTRALQAQNANGTLNSSMAEQAAQAAVYDKALQIASPDAAIYGSASDKNTDTANQFAKDANDYQYQQGILAIQQQYGLDNMAAKSVYDLKLLEAQTLAAKDVADIERSYKNLTQASASATSIMSNMQSSLNAIYANISITDAAIRDSLVKDVKTNAVSALKIIGALAGDVDIQQYISDIGL